MHSSRRDFIHSVVGNIAAAPRLHSQVSSGAAARITVVPSEPVAHIAPEIYGHFIEHLGGVIYDGVWVGENSRIPNSGGTLTAVNPHLDRNLEAEIVVHGASIAGGSGTVLTNMDMHPHNYFEHPDAVRPAPVDVSVRNGRVIHSFPAKSVTALSLNLA